MALIYCPDCGKTVSDNADVCLNCAYPIAKVFRKKTSQISFPKVKLASANKQGYDESFSRSNNAPFEWAFYSLAATVAEIAAYYSASHSDAITTGLLSGAQVLHGIIASVIAFRYTRRLNRLGWAYAAAALFFPTFTLMRIIFLRKLKPRSA